MTYIAPIEAVWNKAEAHMRNGKKGYGFFTAAVVTGADGPRFIPIEYDAVEEHELERDYDAEQSITTDAVLAAINKAKKLGLTLIENHNHPGTARRVRFSMIDERGLPDTAAYMLDSLRKPYAALVWGDTTIDGRWWTEDASGNIEHVYVAGSTNGKLILPDSNANRDSVDLATHDRQVRFLGADGQRLLAQQRVAIVGLSGLGSPLAQQLAYAGVRDFILIEPQDIDRENLNRLVGAGPDDEDDPKLDAMERMIQHIAGGEATIKRIDNDLRHERAYQSLAHADMVFGCVDNDGARQILNEIAKAYALPYLDLASGIDAPEGRFEQAGGHVALVTPTGPCLNCWNLIDRAEARYFLGTKEERAELERLGYVEGWDLPSPSVIFLNSAIASIAVGEFIAYVTGLTPANPLTFYYYREPGTTAQRASARRDAKNPKCFTCAQLGKGDAIELQRYAITDPEEADP